MAELLLVSNPKRRRRRRKMSAKQRRYFGKRRRRRAPTARRRRRIPVAHRTHRRRRRHVVAAAPRRRRRRAHHRRHFARRHRNPFSVRGFTGQVIPTVKDGATGALGALGLDALWGFVVGNATIGPYVANPYIGFAAKAVGAVAVGALGGKLLRGRGRALAVGAMTVVAHDFLKSLLQGMAPTIFGPGGSVPLGSYLSGSAPIVGTATVPQAYLPFSGLGRMGSYLSGSGESLSVNDSGGFSTDTMGMDPWGGTDIDRIAPDTGGYAS